MTNDDNVVPIGGEQNTIDEVIKSLRELQAEGVKDLRMMYIINYVKDDEGYTHAGFTAGMDIYEGHYRLCQFTHHLEELS